MCYSLPTQQGASLTGGNSNHQSFSGWLFKFWAEDPTDLQINCEMISFFVFGGSYFLPGTLTLPRLFHLNLFMYNSLLLLKDNKIHKDVFLFHPLSHFDLEFMLVDLSAWTWVSFYCRADCRISESRRFNLQRCVSLHVNLPGAASNERRAAESVRPPIPSLTPRQLSPQHRWRCC